MLAGRGVEKTKKGSTEFDLQCLLKAAKNKEYVNINVLVPVFSSQYFKKMSVGFYIMSRVLEKIPSPSVGTSSGIDDPSNLVQPYSEENNFQTKHKRSKAYQFAPAKKEYEFNSRSSSENDL